MDILQRYKKWFLLLGMALCILAMVITVRPDYSPSRLAQGFSYVVTPLQSGASYATNWVSSNLEFFWEMRGLQRENAALQEEISWLQLENRRLQLAGEENLLLTELLELRQRYEALPIMGARIIAQDPSDWHTRFTIDRGTNDGFARNMAILGDGGLVGVISEVYPNRAQVTAIIDDSFSVSVQTNRTGDTGVVRGEARGDLSLMQQGLLRMEYIETTASIMAGDEVFTSNISAVFPPGILVGTVVDIQPTPDGLAQVAIVRPAANVRRLENVLVVNRLFAPEYADEE